MTPNKRESIIMCYAVIRTSYLRAAEPAQLTEVATKQELADKIEELTSRPGVQKITWFLPHTSRELVSEWKETQHETSN